MPKTTLPTAIRVMRSLSEHRVFAALALAVATFATAGCGGRDRGGEAPVRKLTAEGEVLRLGHVWQALEEERGIRGAPEKIARFEIKRRSTLTFTDGQPKGEELLEVKEVFELRNGAVFECATQATLPLRVRFGRRHGQPAVEVQRPTRSIPRNCRPDGFPNPELVLGGGSSRYRLQDEQLVGFAPLSEKRVYMPIE